MKYSSKGHKERNKHKLVSWCFKPSQPQRTIRLRETFVKRFVSWLVGALSPVNHKGIYMSGLRETFLKEVYS